MQHNPLETETDIQNVPIEEPSLTHKAPITPPSDEETLDVTLAEPDDHCFVLGYN